MTMGIGDPETKVWSLFCHFSCDTSGKTSKLHIPDPLKEKEEHTL